MRKVLIGGLALLALILGGSVISALLPHSANPILAVAPPSPEPPPASPTPPQPSPEPSPIATPSQTTPSPTPVETPSPSPVTVPSPSPIVLITPSPEPPATPSPISQPPSQWTSLGTVSGVSVYRRCDGAITIYLAIDAGVVVISTQGGATCQP